MASIVFVHGAFQGGWVWKWVAEALEERGHTAHRPTLTGCGHHRHSLVAGVGLNTYVRDIAQYIEDEGLVDVVLVGHSYAGLVCCAVAEALSETVTRLVLLDGVLPQPGKSFADLGGAPFQKLLAAHSTEDGLVRPWPLQSFGVGPEAVPWFGRRLGLFPRAAFTDPSPESGGACAAKRTYISCIPVRNPLLRAMAVRANAEGFEMHALMSGHCAMVSAPLELAGLLHRIIKGAPGMSCADASAQHGELPPLDRQLLEDMRRQLHWTCCRLAKGDESPSASGRAGQTPGCGG
ncbi:MAG: alpha/beta hydrolase [Humidesulfovibrio sp.]|nr:alpha/beta hydrolase [Humidesulfovibrio sp.]